MKILLVGSFEHPMYAPAFESGFKALGNEVVTVKYDDNNHLKTEERYV